MTSASVVFIHYMRDTGTLLLENKYLALVNKIVTIQCSFFLFYVKKFMFHYPHYLLQMPKRNVQFVGTILNSKKMSVN